MPFEGAAYVLAGTKERDGSRVPDLPLGAAYQEVAAPSPQSGYKLYQCLATEAELEAWPGVELVSEELSELLRQAERHTHALLLAKQHLIDALEEDPTLILPRASFLPMFERFLREALKEPERELEFTILPGGDFD